MKRVKDDKKKKTIFVVSLVAVTILLALQFGKYPTRMKILINESSRSLINFYTQTLKPLFYSTQITREDVFGFAQTGQLPINKSKSKFISVKSDVSGNSIYELLFNKKRPANAAGYEKFVKKLNLNETQRERLDSILTFYKNKIYANIYLSKKNSVAVNADLNKLRAALKYDLERFEANLTNKPGKGIYWALRKRLNDTQMLALRRNLLSNIGRNFLLIAPDTVFTIRANGATVKISASDSTEKNIEAFTRKIIGKWAKSNSQSIGIPAISVRKDSTGVFVKIGGNGSKAREEQLVNLFNLNVNKNEESEKVNINFKADTASGNIYLNVTKVTPDSTIKVRINFNPAILSGLITPFVENTDSFTDWDQFDSAFKVFEEDSDFINSGKGESVGKMIEKIIKRTRLPKSKAKKGGK